MRRAPTPGRTRDFYGPMLKAFTTLDTSKHAALKRTVTALLDRQNFGGADTLVIPGEYLEVVVTKA